jgi:hypothetical protein
MTDARVTKSAICRVELKIGFDSSPWMDSTERGQRQSATYWSRAVEGWAHRDMRHTHVHNLSKTKNDRKGERRPKEKIDRYLSF